MFFVASPAVSRDELAPRHRHALVHRSIYFLIIIAIVTIQSPQVGFGQSDDIVVATLDGKSITQREVDDSVAAKLLPLQMQLYAVRKVALENLVASRIIENEAKRLKISATDLRKSMMSGPVDITRDQVESAYRQNASFFGSMNPDEAKERLRLDLETQQRMKQYRTALDKLRESSKLLVTLVRPPLSYETIDGTAPSIGTETAAVRIVEFSDFECRFCKTVQPTLKQVIQEFGETIRLEFRNLPLSGHKNSFTAAVAAFCAGKQDRFWQYHDGLFASGTLTSDYFERLATNLGLNLEKFQTCVSSQESRNAITRDVELAQRFNIESTPSFVINGQLVGGAIGFDEFRRIIEKELRIQGSVKATSSN